MASMLKLLRCLNPNHHHFTSLTRFQSGRHLSILLNPNNNSTTTTPLSTKEKSRAALSLLKSEKNPKRIIEICRAASLTPESHLDRIALSIAISKLAASNDFDSIISFINELLRTRPDLNNEKSVKEYDEVKRVYRKFPGKYGVMPNLDTYNTVIKSFCESGDSSLCYSVIDEMVGNNCKPNATTFSILIAGFYKEEKFEEVGKVLEVMRKHQVAITIATYNTRIQSLCKLNKTDEAKELLDRLSLSGLKPNSVTHCHLIHGYCKEGELEKAKDLFHKMINSGFKPDSDCYFTLVSYMCKAGDFEEALEVCKQSMEKDWVPNFSTMKLLVMGLVKASKVQEARELVGQMKERFPKNAHMWSEVGESLSALEDT
uniref:pentatricopeptide repeat-containing protein At1g61870, mitochondrial-like isoform X2 n=1 Tax=Erigeron canadensis TaxID=72917 RepID=UPI001CB93B95|nr:pentatricopeptide repeat-containing protein At1g61870, mitochondrial-like isoform X2 [Erigeron canadensis]